MSSRAGSTFVTFLMSIPVVAAGMVAFFGVPPLSTVIAATRGLNSKLQNLNSSQSEGSSNSSSQFEEWDSEPAPGWSESGTDDSNSRNHGKNSDKSREVDDLGFSKIEDEKSHSHSHEDDSEDSPRKSRKRRSETPDGHTAMGWRDNTNLLNDSDSSEEAVKPHRDLPGSKAQRASDARTDAPISMKEALKKLNSLGVKHYHLERGADQDTWLFVCLFTPGDDARLTHRFEAESNEPEGAVAETLKQIDSWLLKRFRDKQPISQQAM